MARLPNFLVIIRSEKLSGKGQGRGAKKRTFRFGKKNVSFPKVETFRFADYKRKLASMFNVSRSLIAMVLNPERLQRARELFKERRKDGRYNVSRKERARIIREHRRYKRQLFVEGKIQNSMKNEQEETRGNF